MKTILVLFLAITVCSEGFRPPFIAQPAYQSCFENCKARNLLLTKKPLIHVEGPQISVKPISPIISLWRLARPHTVIGSAVSLLSMFAFAVPKANWFSTQFWSKAVESLIPSLLMNLYVQGLNQLTDVEIDKVNKPYLPIPSGELSVNTVKVVTAAALLLSTVTAATQQWPLRLTLAGAGLLGTLYSLPPFRLKRFPVLAAACILLVRGPIANLGYYFQARAAVLGEKFPSLWNALMKHPRALLVTAFFSVFGAVIALMKDVTDVAGDKKANIESFSVTQGASKMLTQSTYLLLALFHSTLLANVLLNLRYDASLVANAKAVAAVAALFGFQALLVRSQKNVSKSMNTSAVFNHYMLTWNLFYACYLLLPFLT